MTPLELKNKILLRSISYKEYFQNTVEEVANTDPSTLDEISLERLANKKLGLQRSNRIEKTYAPGEEIKSELHTIVEPQLWVVITESWCGDSGQIIPQLAAMVKDNSNINFRILIRDENLEIMDLYLTNGSRSIPVLVAFDKDGNELFKWGPRPQAAITLVKELKAQGLEKKQWLEKLHLWYARNKGVEIEKEILNQLKSLRQDLLTR